MGFTINGELWEPETTGEHATSWMEGINALLEANNVQDEEGNIVKVSQNFASALYLQILAGADRLAKNDEKLQAGLNSLNVELCDEQQIENLLPIAAITRNPGSYSTLTLTVKATDDGTCTIPAGTKAPYGNMNFVVQTTAVLQPGTSQNILTVCDTIGAVAVLAGEITEFENQIPNLESVKNYVSSIPGNDAETTASLRRRILRGETIPYSIDGVKLALEELTGVNHARVFFNYNVSGTITLAGGVVLQPRTAYIVLNGNSDKIAETYAKYMSAPTQNSPGASPTGAPTTVVLHITATIDGATIPANTTFVFDGMTYYNETAATIEPSATANVTYKSVEPCAMLIPSGAITRLDEVIEGVSTISSEASTPGVNKTAYTQNYTTESGQLIPIHYDKAEDETVYVKVFIAKGAETGTQIDNQIKRDLIASSASWIIGENVTSLLTSKPFIDCTYTDIAYTLVSLDGSTWTNIIETPVNSIPRISDSTIIVEEIT